MLKGCVLSSALSLPYPKGLDEIAKERKERHLGNQEYPFVLADVLAIRVGKGGRVGLGSELLEAWINGEG